jgi:hypothetical protein
LDIRLVVTNELWKADPSDDRSASSRNASDNSTDYRGIAREINEDTTKEYGLSNQSKR